jgi:predicted secreted Zn-dependent protease
VDRLWKRRFAPGQPLRRIIVALLATALALDSLGAFAGVTATTATRYYAVGGSSKAGLAQKMRANPFRGDRGGAVANIRPKYSLTVVTTQANGSCRVSRVDLKVRFVMTLPRANESAMSASTRASWRSFVAFARRHEQTHRSIYLQCARDFAAKAQRLKGSSCGGLKAEARRMLNAADRACDKRHAAFDRGERRRLSGQSLFRSTRTAGR